MEASAGGRRSSDDLVERLLEAVRSGDDQTAEEAALEFTERTALLPALRPLLTDADPDRRWWAVRALALVGGEESVRLLIERLTDDDVATRCAAALALGTLGAASAIPQLVHCFEDPDGWVRDSAADALALVGVAAVPALLLALSDTRESVRVRAAHALRKIVVRDLRGVPITGISDEYRQAIPALFYALNDPNRLVRHNAFEALQQIGLLETIIVPP